MSCCTQNGIQCDTVQILEPNDDLLVDTAGSTSDMDERGSVELAAGQTVVSVTFLVPKMSAEFTFEYLYIDAMGNQNPGAIQIVPTGRAREGFVLLLAGSPVETGYVLHWRVTVVRGASILLDYPEMLYVRLPSDTSLIVPFTNPRSTTTYGFSELRVENLVDPIETQAIIHVQVYVKTTVGFGIGINPMPPIGVGNVVNYFLKARTP